MGRQFNKNVTLVVREFVAQLNGRYKSDISDKMLEVLLVHEIKRMYVANSKMGLEYIAYNVGNYIFEIMLDDGCKAGNEGHIVAKDLANKFIEL